MRSFLLGFDSKFSSFEMTRLTQERKNGNRDCDGNSSPPSPKGQVGNSAGCWRSSLWFFEPHCEEKRQRKPKYDPDEMENRLW
jgi:hypothetical protein